MKQFYVPAVMLSLAVLVSCSKKEEEKPNNNNNNTNTACNGMNLCFKLDGTQETHNAQWKILSDRYRIYWEESGTPYKNIEIDIYSTKTGTYQIDSAKGSKTDKSGFQYYVNGSKNIQGYGGSIVISEITTDNISGTFTVDAWDKDAKKAYKITEGNFVSVKK